MRSSTNTSGGYFFVKNVNSPNALNGFPGDGTMRLQKEAPKPEFVAAHENAAASCLKLVRGTRR